MLNEQFWEQKHYNADNVWLTGTMFSQLLAQYKIDLPSLTQASVLEIGVGLGHCSNQFQAYSKVFYAADISLTALKRIEKNCKNVFLTGDLDKIPPVDLAICHLVFVHCTDQEVVRILNDINLTNNGTLMFQLSSFAKNYYPSADVKEDLMSNGSHFFRSLSDMEKLINDSNKKILSVSEPYDPGRYLNYDLAQEFRIITVENKN